MSDYQRGQAVRLVLAGLPGHRVLLKPGYVTGQPHGADFQPLPERSRARLGVTTTATAALAGQDVTRIGCGTWYRRSASVTTRT